MEFTTDFDALVRRGCGHLDRRAAGTFPSTRGGDGGFMGYFDATISWR